MTQLDETIERMAAAMVDALRVHETIDHRVAQPDALPLTCALDVSSRMLDEMRRAGYRVVRIES